jgi:hypothetical protein
MIPRRLAIGAEENHDVAQYTRFPIRDLNSGLIEYEAQYCPLYRTYVLAKDMAFKARCSNCDVIERPSNPKKINNDFGFNFNVMVTVSVQTRRVNFVF